MARSIHTGSLLRLTFKTFSAGAGSFVSIALIVHLPLLMLSFGMAFHRVPGAQAEVINNLLSSFILTPIASAALVYGVFRHIRGEGSTISECLEVGLRRWPSVVGLSILTGIAVGIGFIMCIVPGLVVISAVFPAVPILVVEKRSVFDSFHRSWDLTEYYRLSIFGLAFVITLLTFAGGALVGGLLLPVEAVPTQTLSPIYLVAIYFLTGVLSALQAVASAVAYHELRIHKEGLDEDELAAVFD